MVAEGKFGPTKESMPAIVSRCLQEGVSGMGNAGDVCMKMWNLGKFVGTKNWCNLSVDSPVWGLGKLRFRFSNGVNDEGGFTVEDLSHGKVYVGVRADQLTALVDVLVNPDLAEGAGIEIVAVA